MLLLLNVSVTYIAATTSDHLNITKDQKHQIDVSQITNSTDNHTSVQEQTTGSLLNNNSLNSSNVLNQLNLLNLAFENSVRTYLDHLNEPNKENSPIYTDQYVVQILGGPKLAKELSEKHDFVYLGQVMLILFFLSLFRT